MPLFVLVGALVALLVTYPYATLSVGTLLYLAHIPVAFHRYRTQLRAMEDDEARHGGQGQSLSIPKLVVEPPRSDRMQQ